MVAYINYYRVGHDTLPEGYKQACSKNKSGKALIVSRLKKAGVINIAEYVEDGDEEYRYCVRWPEAEGDLQIK